MPNSSRQPATSVLGVRLEPAVMRQVHQHAATRGLNISDATRQLLAVGLEQVHQAR
jgi:hypothetical protein